MIIWLSAGLSVEHFNTFKVYMKESVSGLSLNSPVEYNGVNVGSVKTISLDHENPQWVEVLLSINATTPITRGTTATLNAKGLTGIAFIELRDKGIDTEPLTKQPGEDYPVINTAPSFFLRLDTALTQLNQSFGQLSNSVRSMMDKENLQSLKAILLNIKDLTATLSASRPQIAAILHNAENASLQFTPAMNVLTSQTLPQANQTFSNLNAASSNLVGISSELKNNPAVLISGKAQRKPGPGE
jgi:phospholipid/cholesterol/gamma-HCH transport system substrate-binding protein